MINYSWDLKTEELNLELDYLDEKKFEDMLWQARTGLDKDSLCGAIESIVFMAEKPISINKIKKFIDPEIPLRAIFEAIERLQEDYEKSHHGIRLLEVAEGYQFRTKATFAHIIQKTFSTTSLSLTPATLEVLAIIAYKQPITKNDIENIRGVDSAHLIRTLMDKKLVKIGGRSEDLGRSLQYETTLEFLDIFNLKNITELPTEEELLELANKNEVGKINEIKEIVGSGDKSKFYYDEIEELDNLSSAIKEIQTDTNFLRSIHEENKLAKRDNNYEKKSAFDLLEEFVHKKELVEANAEAMESDLILNTQDSRVVPLDELDGYINFNFEPDTIDFEDEEIEDDEAAQVVAAELEPLYDVEEAALKEEDKELINELSDLNSELNFEEIELDKALDQAFDNLMGQSQEIAQNLEEIEQELSSESSEEPVEVGEESPSASEEVLVGELSKELHQIEQIDEESGEDALSFSENEIDQFIAENFTSEQNQDKQNPKTDL